MTQDENDPRTMPYGKAYKLLGLWSGLSALCVVLIFVGLHLENSILTISGQILAIPTVVMTFYKGHLFRKEYLRYWESQGLSSEEAARKFSINHESSD